MHSMGNLSEMRNSIYDLPPSYNQVSSTSLAVRAPEVNDVIPIIPITLQQTNLAEPSNRNRTDEPNIGNQQGNQTILENDT